MAEQDRNTQGFGGKDAGQTTPEQEYWQRQAVLRGEGSIYHELIMSSEKGDPRLAIRMACATFERDTVFDMHPNRMYAEEQYLQVLAYRAKAIRYIYPLRPTLDHTYFDQEEKKMVTIKIPRPGYIEDREERDRLVEELEKARDEASARMALNRKLINEQKPVSGDIDSYAQSFLIRGKELVATNNYAIILNAEPTIDGLTPFGRKVATAFSAWRNIGRGKAEILLEDGTKKHFPNIFGLPANRGLLEHAMGLYIIPKIAEGATTQANDNLLELDDADNEAAAILALELFQHWDYDAMSAMASKETGESLLAGIADITDVNLEAGALTKDTAKMILEVRRALEATSGGEHREHMRGGWGNPITRGCFPILSAPALDVISCDMALTEDQRNNIQSGVHLSEGETLTVPHKIKMTIHDRVFGDEENGENRYVTRVPVTIKDSNGEERKEWIISDYAPTHLGDRSMWDSAEIIYEAEGDFLRFTYGAQTEAFEAPYKLQVFYIWKSMYQFIMTENYKQQYKAATDVGGENYLLKANKAWDTGLGILLESKGITGELARKFNNYTRATWMGGLAAAQVEGHVNTGPEEGGTLIQGGEEVYLNQVLQELSNAAARSKFLPIATDGRDRGKVRGGWWGLVERIAKSRKAAKPSECVLADGSKLFTPEELDRLKPLYPLGV